MEWSERMLLASILRSDPDCFGVYKTYFSNAGKAF